MTDLPPATPAAPRLDSRTFCNPAAWRPQDVADRSRWVFELGESERSSLAELGQWLVHQGATTTNAAALADRNAAVLLTLAPRLARIRQTLQHGLGFALMRGFPVERMSPEATRLAYVALGSLLGQPMAQNRQGEMLHDVRDVGADRHDPNVRLSRTNAEQDFHTDAADIIGLLCLQKARSGGESRIVSSVTVYQEIVTERPDLAKLLFEPWFFHFKGEQPAGSAPYFTLPIAQHIDNQLSTFFIGWYLRDAEKLDGVPALSDDRRELLDLYERVANREDLGLRMQFEPGDVQWLKNSVILHKRSEYEDWPEPERKRHLLRLWLAADDFKDGIVAIRKGYSEAAASATAAAAEMLKGVAA